MPGPASSAHSMARMCGAPSTSPDPGRQPGPGARALRWRRRLPYLLVLPVCLMLALLYAYPMVLLAIESFEKVPLIGTDASFVGLSNYQRIFSSSSFYSTLWLTLRYTLVAGALKILVGLAMALFLSSRLYFKKTLRFLSLLPWAMPQVVAALVWGWILNSDYGYLNYVLMQLGLITGPVAWLSNPTTAFYAAAIVDAWLGVSLVSMMFMAALSSVPRSTLEAAALDGAGAIRRFFTITLPHIRKVLLVVCTLVCVWTFNSFNVIFTLTGGGPMRATETLVIRIYQEAYSNFDIGLSSALAMVAFAILAAGIMLYYRQIKEQG